VVHIKTHIAGKEAGMKDGYYWVNWNDWWQIGLYRDGVFTFTACERDIAVEEVEEVGNYIETPEKYKP